MKNESTEAASGLSMEHFSYDALQSATWMQFERFSIEVLSRYYEPFGLLVRRTEKQSGGDIGSDGTRDGEATVIFAGSPDRAIPPPADISSVGPDLSVVLTLWVEVKQRSSNVNHHDLGGTLFRSSLEYVTKIIFVTNSSFTKPFKKRLSQYALKNGMQFALIDGESLIRIAEKVVKTKRKRGKTKSNNVQTQPRPPVDVRLRFASDPLLRYSDITTEVVERAVGEPLFVVADCLVDESANPHPSLSVELRHGEARPFDIAARSGSKQHAVGAGDHFRSVFVIFPERPGELSLDDFRLLIYDEEGRKVDGRVTRSREKCVVRGTILPDWIPPSRARAHDLLRGSVDAWADPAAPQQTATRAVDIVAIAGAGKSHLVRSVRKSWLRRGVYEVFLDGGGEHTATAVALALLGQIFPLPMDEVSNDLAKSLAEWLTRVGMTEGAAATLARAVSNLSAEGELPFKNEQLGHFLALILAKRSEQHPILLVFEDLHKCYPSSVSMLRSLRQSLTSLGRGKVLTLFTTREDSIWNDEAMRSDWRSSMEMMRAGSDTLEVRLSGFSKDEARELIRAAVPTVEEHYAVEIIEQVGTTPFGAREALGLLLERGILEPAERNGTWRLVKPDELPGALDSQVLRRATHYRLMGLRERYPDWLADFLDSGACLGRVFDPQVCAHNALVPARGALEKALAECRALEVIAFPLAAPSKLQFDHDLIRSVLLQDMGCARQRRVAGGLFKELVGRESDMLLSSLAYQAGLADECWGHAIKQADSAENSMRHMEAVQALGLAISVTDQNTVTKIFGVDEGRFRPAFDEAVGAAEPCMRSKLRRERRERETAGLLLRYAENLVAVGSAGTPSADRAVTEGSMLAAKLGDQMLRATFKMFHGRQEFSRDNPVEALRLHLEAESIFSAMEPGEDVDKQRARNFVRMAIAYRANGQLEESRRTLLKALRERRGRSWSLVTRVRANYGATYFYLDWAVTRRHWQRALLIAKRRGLTHRYVHGLIDVAFLDLLEDHDGPAERGLEEALGLCHDYCFENSELRCLLNLGCLALMRGDFQQALELLREADSLGFRHRIGRRLWRVRANMATAYFALGDVAASLATDRITLNSMPPLGDDSPLLDEKHLFASTRLILALANIALRAESSEEHRELLQSLPQRAQASARELARGVIRNEIESLPGLRGRHCKRVGLGRFFLITE